MGFYWSLASVYRKIEGCARFACFALFNAHIVVLARGAVLALVGC